MKLPKLLLEGQEQTHEMKLRTPGSKSQVPREGVDQAPRREDSRKFGKVDGIQTGSAGPGEDTQQSSSRKTKPQQ